MDSECRRLGEVDAQNRTTNNMQVVSSYEYGFEMHYQTAVPIIEHNVDSGCFTTNSLNVSRCHELHNDGSVIEWQNYLDVSYFRR